MLIAKLITKVLRTETERRVNSDANNARTAATKTSDRNTRFS